jgi:hypothetical protein
MTCKVFHRLEARYLPLKKKSPISDTSANPRTVFDPILHVAGRKQFQVQVQALVHLQ